MNPFESWTADELLGALDVAGRLPDLDLIRACLTRPDELTPALLAWLDPPQAESWPADDPRGYRAIHAGLLLIAYREPAALPLFRTVFQTERHEELIEWFETELPAYGPAATTWALDLVNDRNTWEQGKIAAAEILTAIAWHYPEERERVVAGLCALLPPLDPGGGLSMAEGYTGSPDPLWTWAAYGLAQLQHVESRPQVTALYEQGLMDEMVMGDVDAYLTHFEAGAHPPAVSYYEFDIIDTYESLYRMAARDAEPAARRPQQTETAQPSATSARSAPATASPWARQAPFVRSGPKIGRNDPCPCGSGKKYKHCHGKKG